jgi:hypothetical protein
VAPGRPLRRRVSPAGNPGLAAKNDGLRTAPAAGRVVV